MEQVVYELSASRVGSKRSSRPSNESALNWKIGNAHALTFGVKSSILHSSMLTLGRTSRSQMFFVHNKIADKDQNRGGRHNCKGDLWRNAGPCCHGYKTESYKLSEGTGTVREVGLSDLVSGLPTVQFPSFLQSRLIYNHITQTYFYNFR